MSYICFRCKLEKDGEPYRKFNSTKLVTKEDGTHSFLREERSICKKCSTIKVEKGTGEVWKNE